MKRRFICHCVGLLLSILFVISLAGCNMEIHQKNSAYVSNVKRLVDDSVTYTRKLRQQDDSFDCRDNEKVRGYLLVADDLINTLEQIQKLRATDEFDAMDKPLKTSAKSSLQIISQIKALIVYAQENGDDDLYQREKSTYFNDYYGYYDQMKELSSEIQTYWRNA